ncbi:uncharacterized protein I206_100074 [Kwoniella pini CBS 10737]|uniref:Uncharacterized protein n=1 Tax=Kwoniella pini CBS 10737 TaxID=1296096 RepID=A0A1B9HSJ5_9TREE|nr:uncharacterized protein I206_07889 [Kwoniella pini CBS 10737]OCF46218.1 hypothetical protein I206_07889 [Kwoniella pini CBS 10737]
MHNEIYGAQGADQSNLTMTNTGSALVSNATGNYPIPYGTCPIHQPTDNYTVYTAGEHWVNKDDVFGDVEDGQIYIPETAHREGHNSEFRGESGKTSEFSTKGRK